MYRCHLEACGVPPLKGGKAAKLGELIARFGRLFLSCPDDIFGASKRLRWPSHSIHLLKL